VREVTRDQILARLRVENPWWEPPHGIPGDWERLGPRRFLEAFWPLFRATSPHRALVLLGPRRVGKTVLLHHAIARAIREGTPAGAITYLSLDTPLYTDHSLEELFQLALQASGRTDPRGAVVIFDEIQYLRDWEQHLKSLVDTYRSTRFVASGSAAAALKLKNDESGAGRFTDVLMPPLTFIEFLIMLDREDLAADCLTPQPEGSTRIAELNDWFVEYINSGGYPEAVQVDEVRRDPVRFIRQDVIDKVLLRDLPSL
jgi:predicted AAA+ superfamily ATPase